LSWSDFWTLSFGKYKFLIWTSRHCRFFFDWWYVQIGELIISIEKFTGVILAP